MNTTTTSERTKPEETTQLLERYTEAWRSGDAARNMAFHTADTVFHLHDGSAPVQGADAVRTVFALVLTAYPDLHFEAVDVVVGDGHATVQSVMHATVAGRAMAVDAVDVFHLVDGHVSRKDTYLDTLTLRAAAAT